MNDIVEILAEELLIVRKGQVPDEAGGCSLPGLAGQVPKISQTWLRSS